MKESSRSYFVIVSSSSPSVLLPSPSLNTATVIHIHILSHSHFTVADRWFELWIGDTWGCYELRVYLLSGLTVSIFFTHYLSTWIAHLYFCINTKIIIHLSKQTLAWEVHVCIYLQTPDGLQSTTSTHQKKCRLDFARNHRQRKRMLPLWNWVQVGGRHLFTWLCWKDLIERVQQRWVFVDFGSQVSARESRQRCTWYRVCLCLLPLCANLIAWLSHLRLECITKR